MDNQRLFLYAGLLFLGLLIWQQWEVDYAPRPPPARAPEASDAPQIPSAERPEAEPVPEDVPEDVPDEPPAPTSVAQPDTVPADGATPAPSGSITVTTDLLRLEIALRGGGIRKAELLRYPVSVKEPDNLVRLLDDDPRFLFVAESGLLSKQPAPSHHALYTAEQASYRLADGEDELVVPLTWTENGVTVTKRLHFKRDRYVFEVTHTVDNGTAEPWSGRQYRQLKRKAITDDEQSRFIYTFIGGVILDEENKYEKIDFDDFADLEDRHLTNSWLAIIEHYFLAAWVPERDEVNTLYTKALRNEGQQRYLIGMYSPTVSVAPGATQTFSSRLFVGPKEQDRLEQAADKLRLTVDYGVLTIIAEPLFWLLSKIHEFVGNWGWSIVVVTILIKLVFYKLSELSYRSMARMRKLQPKLQSLKERFGDDRQKMGQATMELYRKEKINPLGGCLPMLVQIPVFIALYWTLLESVELRQAPFVLWIEDLSVRDPFFVLPLVMGVTMFVQQKLNPTPVDPVQAKIFMLLPFIFTAFFAFFPAGLVLYWAVNNLLSILQQYYITRHVLAEK